LYKETLSQKIKNILKTRKVKKVCQRGEKRGEIDVEYSKQESGLSQHTSSWPSALLNTRKATRTTGKWPPQPWFKNRAHLSWQAYYGSGPEAGAWLG
jgi:hypothetical protein